IISPMVEAKGWLTLPIYFKEVLRRPVDFFYDIQFNNRAKWSHAIVLILLMIAVKMISISVTGYSFETRESYQISFLFETVWLIIPLASWCISNWAVSTILDGEGKFKDIVVSGTYAFAPYILLMVPIALLSNILTHSE